MADESKDKKGRAGVIGCGAMGRHHINALASMDDVELVAVADVMAENLERAGEEGGVGTAGRFLDYEELLDQQRPDFIVVATQAPQHAEITIAAAERGVHVLCEKPLALDLAEADSMVKACDAAGVRLAVNHLRRTAPAGVMARDLIAAGEIGEVLGVEIHDKGGRPLGNTLMEMATHYFDEARFLLSGWSWGDGPRPDELKWVYAHLSTGIGADAHPASPEEIMPSIVAKPGDRDCGLVLGDRGTVVLGFAGEVQGVSRIYDLPTADPSYEGLDVIGTQGSLAVRGDFFKRLFRRRGHTFAADDPWVEIEVPDSLDPATTGYEQAVRDLCQRMAREMMASITEGREHVSSGDDGLVALESLMAVYASHRRRLPVHLPLAERGHPLEAWQREG